MLGVRDDQRRSGGQANWVDRRGNLVRTLPQPANTELLNPEVSPDGGRVAGSRMDPATGNWDIWIVDVGLVSRLA